MTEREIIRGIRRNLFTSYIDVFLGKPGAREILEGYRDINRSVRRWVKEGHKRYTSLGLYLRNDVDGLHDIPIWVRDNVTMGADDED
jgi:hypothetical protein